MRETLRSGLRAPKPPRVRHDSIDCTDIPLDELNHTFHQLHDTENKSLGEQPTRPASTMNKRLTMHSVSEAAKMRLTSINEQSTGPGGAPAAWIRALLRLLQFTLALAVCGLYGHDLDTAAKRHAGANSDWTYAVVIGGASAVTCLVYLAPIVKSWVFWPWDLLLFMLWTAVFGRFAQKFLHADPKRFKSGVAPSYARMRHAMWIDMVCMILWFVTGVWGMAVFFFHRKRTLHTGRAEV